MIGSEGVLSSVAVEDSLLLGELLVNFDSNVISELAL